MSPAKNGRDCELCPMVDETEFQQQSSSVQFPVSQTYSEPGRYCSSTSERAEIPKHAAQIDAHPIYALFIKDVRLIYSRDYP